MVRRLVISLIIALFLYVGMMVVTEQTPFSYVLRTYYVVKQMLLHPEPYRMITVPPLPESIHSDEYYVNHWRGDRGYFVLVGEKNVISYTAPDIHSTEYEPLPITKRVKILFQQSSEVEIDGETQRWVFISNESGDRYLGWVFLDQLIFPHQFLKLEEPTFDDFNYDKGEYSANVKVDRDGSFFIDWEAKGRGLFLEGEETGQFYDYDQILWAKKDEQDYFVEFFYLDSSDTVQQEVRFKVDSITMNRYTLPKDKIDLSD